MLEDLGTQSSTKVAQSYTEYIKEEISLFSAQLCGFSVLL
jgi:hypothetical protein